MHQCHLTINNCQHLPRPIFNSIEQHLPACMHTAHLPHIALRHLLAHLHNPPICLFVIICWFVMVCPLAPRRFRSTRFTHLTMVSTIGAVRSVGIPPTTSHHPDAAYKHIPCPPFWHVFYSQSIHLCMAPDHMHGWSHAITVKCTRTHKYVHIQHTRTHSQALLALVLAL